MHVANVNNVVVILYIIGGGRGRLLAEPSIFVYNEQPGRACGVTSKPDIVQSMVLMLAINQR